MSEDNNAKAILTAWNLLCWEVGRACRATSSEHAFSSPLYDALKNEPRMTIHVTREMSFTISGGAAFQAGQKNQPLPTIE